MTEAERARMRDLVARVHLLEQRNQVLEGQLAGYGNAIRQAAEFRQRNQGLQRRLKAETKRANMWRDRAQRPGMWSRRKATV